MFKGGKGLRRIKKRHFFPFLYLDIFGWVGWGRGFDPSLNLLRHFCDWVWTFSKTRGEGESKKLFYNFYFILFSWGKWLALVQKYRGSRVGWGRVLGGGVIKAKLSMSKQKLISVSRMSSLSRAIVFQFSLAFLLYPCLPVQYSWHPCTCAHNRRAGGNICLF